MFTQSKDPTYLLATFAFLKISSANSLTQLIALPYPTCCSATNDPFFHAFWCPGIHVLEIMPAA